MSVTTMTTPGHIVAAAPYLIGFQPEESLVIIWLNDEGMVTLTQRTDLNDGFEAEMIQAGVSHGFSKAIIITFSKSRPVEFLSMHYDVGDALESVGIDIVDLLHCSGDRYWSYLVSAEELMTSPGFEIDEDTMLTVKSRFALEGMAVMPSRNTLVEQVKPSDDHANRWGAAKGYWTRLANDTDDLSARMSAVDYAVNLYFDYLEGHEPDVTSLLRVSASLQDVRVRDAVIQQAAQVDNQEGAYQLYDLCAMMCRVTPVKHAAPALVVTGICAYLMGNGAATNACLDTALEIDPYIRLASMISQAVNSGLHPDNFRESLSELTLDQIMNGGE